MGSGRDDNWRALMEATLVPPAERLPRPAPRRERATESDRREAAAREEPR